MKTYPILTYFTPEEIDRGLSFRYQSTPLGLRAENRSCFLGNCLFENEGQTPSSTLVALELLDRERISEGERPLVIELARDFICDNDLNGAFTDEDLPKIVAASRTTLDSQ